LARSDCCYIAATNPARCRSLPRLGERVRTNSEALLGSVARDNKVNFSKGIAITSIFNADAVTRIEPVRYPEGSDLMRILAAPLISNGHAIPVRMLKSIGWILRHPLDFLRSQVLPGWARRVTILLVMQNVDNRLNVRLGRSLLTFFRKGLVAETEPGHEINARVDAGHDVTRAFAEKPTAFRWVRWARICWITPPRPTSWAVARWERMLPRV
jgi:cholesterol oxidase